MLLGGAVGAGSPRTVIVRDGKDATRQVSASISHHGISSAGNSMIPNRMNRRDVNGMPPLGSNEIDTAGLALINAWINSLGGCN